jgi:antitoxin HicB
MVCRKNPHIGSTLESFLKEEGICESATRKAVKTVVAWQMAEEMRRRGVKKPTE